MVIKSEKINPPQRPKARTIDWLEKKKSGKFILLAWILVSGSKKTWVLNETVEIP